MVDLSPNINTREFDKFGLNENNETYVRTSGEGTFQQSGLKLGGKITELDIDNTTWTPFTVTPLTKRNQINIQNESGQLVKLRYDVDVGFVGVYIKSGMERQYTVQGTIVMYFKSEESACKIVIEELA